MKARHICACICAAAISVCVAVSAHPGRTDSSGGHWNRSTGKYHYHHGYPAHQHPNGVCPYDYDDKTGEDSGSSVVAPVTPAPTAAPTPTATPEPTETLSDKVLEWVLLIIILYFFPGAFIVGMVEAFIDWLKNRRSRKR